MKPEWIDPPALCFAAFLWLTYFWFSLQGTQFDIHWALAPSWGVLAVIASIYAGSCKSNRS